MRSTCKQFLPVLLTACLGCNGLTIPSVVDEKKPVVVVDTIFSNLAEYVEGGDLVNTDQLDLLVKRLRARGKIDDNQVKSIHDAFPGMQSKQLPLSRDDAAKIRGLK